MDYLLSIYGCLFLIGILGNGMLGVTLCCEPGAKTRSPLLFGLISADFIVCSVAGPFTAALYVVTSWTQTWFHIALFMQAWPVAASTLSLMVLSVDRYLTVKNYRPAGQVAARRNLLMLTVLFTWIIAAFLSSSQMIIEHPWKKTMDLIRILLVHVLPAFAVLISHLGVHLKLTALSLTARAKHGELPLPMPLLRRPTHVIIVAGMPKPDKKHLQLQISEKNIEEENQPPTSTLRSRRRLANALLWIAIFFALSWLPYVICQLYKELSSPVDLTVERYTLLVGHFHSALSPILYWSMNNQWPQRPFKRFRIPTIYRSASSTNEAALGPFHPRLVKPPPMRRRSSHYLY